MSLEISPNLYYVGAYDADLRIFDIIMETGYGTSYNSYILKTSEGNVLFETAKERCYDEFMGKIKSVIGDEKFAFIVCNHTEPDHSGSLARILEEHSPDATVIGTTHAIDYLEQITNRSDFKRRPVEVDNKESHHIKVGEFDLQFHIAPFLHWPDSMFTYIPQLKTVFTCDFLGAHFCPNPETTLVNQDGEDYWDAFKYYYDCIFGPFPKYVAQGVAILKTMDLETVGTSHGPVLVGKENIAKRIEKYAAWGVVPEREHRVVVGYTSAYGYTGEMAAAIVEGLKAADPTLKVESYDLGNRTMTVDAFIGFMNASEGVIIGSPTINGEALPHAWQIVTALNTIAHKGMVAAVFGSYGWSGQATKNLHERLTQLTSMKKPLSPLAIRFRASEDDIAKCREYGSLFAKSVLGERVTDICATEDADDEADKFTFIPDGKLHRWKCVVCGEIVISDIPPEMCEACGAGADAFVLLPDEDDETTEYAGHVVVIGGGPAAFNAARTARDRAPGASVTLISAEKHLPYYRMNISHGINNVCMLKPDAILLKPAEWYYDNNITVRLGEEVTKIDREQHTIETAEDVIPYDKLVIATGGSPFIPYKTVHPCGNSISIRTIEDIEKISNRICHENEVRVVVIGGGVLGLECLPFLLTRDNVSITVVERSPHIMSVQVDSCMACRVEKYLMEQSKGRLSFKTNAVVTDFTITDNQIQALTFEDGSILDADLVIWAIGVRSNVSLASDAGIKTGRGVLVNDRMVSSDPNVLACGDCSEQMGGIFAPNWASAVEGGNIAGAVAVGLDKEYPKQPFPFMLNIYERTVMALGRSSGRGAEPYYLNQGDDVTTKIFHENGAVVGASKLGGELQCVELASAIGEGMSSKAAQKWLFK
ncbi:FAD-dependent pyridine nucleotide-disulfide oxidoreductase [Carpediemonas membranifera]|uniref:FAD-dependent pyridine nucleotide-disulfide oxidoreductase n=1 Tax=Carpediemonas membranifera TaxID=201153 RepID=A0A8J6AW02_9EUKA|nr:FAD-dependent pyridine nucleotide-disulfide oxidoreductase [Carpediemonas membranifera]|eukprot:KAG9396196.1 FAD-dependent pyridine nucleotide-disulfide oxidoreductase [Carpediemonas membranifera]